MPIPVSQPKGQHYLTPKGNHLAVCYGVWDLGIQQLNWQGQTMNKHQIVVAWELNEMINDPDNREYHNKRYVCSRTYTASLHKKARLRIDLENWRGQPFTKEELECFDVEKLIGVSCMIQISHNETENGTYANVTNVSGLPKGTTPMVPENPPTPPKWVQDKQSNAIPEDEASQAPQEDYQPPVDDSDSLPF